MSSPKINKEVENHFGCPGRGMSVEDQDLSGGSHWEYHDVGS